MEDRRRDEKTGLGADVVVIGGVLAGQAAAIHLSRRGLQVICPEPRESFHHIVGESHRLVGPAVVRATRLDHGGAGGNGGGHLQETYHYCRARRITTGISSRCVAC